MIIGSYSIPNPDLAISCIGFVMAHNCSMGDSNNHIHLEERSPIPVKSTNKHGLYDTPHTAMVSEKT